MIDKSYGTYRVVCDSCGIELDETYDYFDDAVFSMKAEGWRSVNVSGVWQNYCPKCAKELHRPGASEFAGI